MIGLQFQPNANPPNGNVITQIVQVPDVAPNQADGTLPTPVWQPLFSQSVAQPLYAG